MKYFDNNTLRFLLFDILKIEEVTKLPYYQDHDKENMNIFLDAISDFGDKSFYPFFREMDEKPAIFENGAIKAHPQIGVIMKSGADMGLINGDFSYEEGGLQMPKVLYTAAFYILEAANNSLCGYLGLTNGAAELILAFGNEELKNKYVPKMLTGDWGGTMCLTEPQAGSSLSDIVTAAKPLDDGSYSINGQKIFISGGDHPYAENFVHLVLARIEGAPAGTKGISLFVVPKKGIAEDGSLVYNDVATAGDFQKLGQRGYCTTHLFFGENEDCKGWLVGEPHRGLNYMFLMMNSARISVGRGAAAIAMAAYQASLKYANERAQGRPVSSSGAKDVSSGQTLIMNHPDVRRMLLLQKAIAEGSLSIVLQTAKYYDIQKRSTSKEERQQYKLLLELMTPVVKTCPSEMGKTAVDAGLQVLGGYGFCSEYVLQQYYRDIRIFPIYEGTTGIQAKDLLGRKVLMADGKAMLFLAQEINKTIQEALAIEELKPYGKILSEKLQQCAAVTAHLTEFAKKGEFERFLADATIYMEFFSHLIMGWQLLRMANVAEKALNAADKNYENSFYLSKVHTMKFYFKYQLVQMDGLAKILMDDTVLTIPEGEEVIC